MIIRNNKYPNYIIKRHDNGITIFRDGEKKPLKPVKGNKKVPVFSLWVNGCKYNVSIFQFLIGCYDDLKLKI